MASKKKEKSPAVEAAEQGATLHALKGSLKIAKSGRKKTDDNWDKMLKWFRGQQKNKKIGAKRSNHVTNFIFAQVETIVPILTSAVPGIAFRPEIDFGDHAERWIELAKELERLQNRVLRRNHIVERQTEIVTYGILWGKGYYKVTFDPDMYGGFGDIRIDTPDPRSIFLEPGKMRIRDANYVFEVPEVDQLSLMRKHPDKAAEIRKIFRNAAGDEGDVNLQKKEALVANVPTAPDVAASTDTVRFFDAVDGASVDKQIVVDLNEAWFYDDELVDGMIEIMNMKTGEVDRKPGRVRKFPNGRLMQFTDNTIFTDKSNDFPGLPYFEYFNYFVPGEPYGMGDIEQAIPIQEQYNIRSNQLSDGLNYHFHPIRLFDSRSGFDPNLASNAPDAWNEVNSVEGIRELQPNMPGAAAFESLETRKREIETIFGVREITQGTIPGDIRSGTAIEALQEAADVRLRRKSAAIESMVKDMAVYMVSMIGKFYKPGVHYDERFHSEGHPSGIGLDNITGHMFDIEIAAGVNRPRSKVAQQQERQWMLDKGIIDEIAYIEAATIDNKDRIIERMEPLWKKRKELALNPEQPTPGGP